MRTLTILTFTSFIAVPTFVAAAGGYVADEILLGGSHVARKDNCHP
jgi:hypothetical protein